MALLRWLVGGFLFVALLFLSLQNSDLVTVRFYHWFSWQAPLDLPAADRLRRRASRRACSPG